MAQVIALFGICIGLIAAMFGVSQGQDAWAMIHFLQLVLILPLITTSISRKVKEFIVSNAF